MAPHCDDGAIFDVAKFASGLIAMVQALKLIHLQETHCNTDCTLAAFRFQQRKEDSIQSCNKVTRSICSLRQMETLSHMYRLHMWDNVSSTHLQET